MSNTPLISDSSRAETAVEYARWERERERQRIEIQEGPKAAAAFAARHPVEPAPDAPPDLGDPAEILDPPEAVFQVGPHRLVFRELTYKQAKGLLGLGGRIFQKILLHPDTKILATLDAASWPVFNIGPLMDVAGEEIVAFICQLHGLNHEEFETAVKLSDVVAMVRTLVEQNAHEIGAVVAGLKKTRAALETTGLWAAVTGSTGETR